MAKNPKTRLTTFIWQGVDAKGRKIKGETEAPNPAFVAATLRRQGVRASKIRRKRSALFGSLNRRPVKTKDITIATRQLATMIAAGIPIAQSYESIAKGHENPQMVELLTSIRQEVEAGTNLSRALARYPAHFDRLYVNLVAAGEQSGALDSLLEKIASHMEKIEAIKGKIKSAMWYPAAIVLVAIVVVSLLLIFVIPQFEQLFQNFGGQLPTLTQTIIDLSRWFQEWYWLFFGILIAVTVTTSFAYKRSSRMQFLADRLVLRVPMLGEILRKATIARFARTLATMFGAGVPLVDSLESVAAATGNRVYYNGIMEIRNDVATGRSLEASMMTTGLFPSMVLQMIATGEDSGELELMLDKVADFFEREVDDAVAALSSLLEPVMIVFLGIVVGTMVIAMYLPIFKMAAVF